MSGATNSTQGEAEASRLGPVSAILIAELRDQARQQQASYEA